MKSYKNKIKKACISVGTYRPEFDIVIAKLSDILCEYDEAKAEVDENGRFVAHTNKSGATNLELSPAAVTMRQCRTDALPYFRDLGLTPAGLKKLDAQKKEDSSLMNALRSLGS